MREWRQMRSSRIDPDSRLNGAVILAFADVAALVAAVERS
jgi:acyl-coenzyme A thioesterase PaaI-like protein